MRAFQAQRARMTINLGGRAVRRGEPVLEPRTFQAVDGVLSFDDDDPDNALYAADLDSLIKSGTRPDLTTELREMDASTTDAYRRQQQAKKTPAAARGVFGTGTAPGSVQRREPGAPATPYKTAASAGAGVAEAKTVDAMPGTGQQPEVVAMRDPATAGPNAAGNANANVNEDRILDNSDVGNRMLNAAERNQADASGRDARTTPESAGTVAGEQPRESVMQRLQRTNAENEARKAADANTKAAIDAAKTGPQST